MNDEVDNNGEDATTDKEKSGPVGGERLAEHRRRQQITVLEIAKELHLDEPKVRALEQNKFDVLGAPVFAKGHLKKYSQLVGANADDVFADYYELTRESGMPPVVGKKRKKVREISPGPWIAVIVVIIVAAAAYWWFTSRPVVAVVEPASDGATIELPRQPAAETISTAEQDTPEPEPEVAETIEEILPPEIDTSGSSGASARVDPAPVSTSPLAAGEVRISLLYSDDCWTEVTDANGRRLFFDLGTSGRNVDVAGTAPLSILLGSADNVGIQVNGVDYDISAADRRGRTARLTIQAQ